MFQYEQNPLDTKEEHILRDFASLSDEDFIQRFSGHVPSFAREFHENLHLAMQLLKTNHQQRNYPNFTYIPIMHFEFGTSNYHALRSDVFKVLEQLPQVKTLFVSGESDLATYTRNTLTKDKQRLLANARGYLGNLVIDPKSYYKMEGWEQALLDFVNKDPHYSVTGTDINQIADVMPRILVDSRLITPPTKAHEMSLLLLEMRTRIALVKIATSIKSHEAIVFFQGFGHAYGVKAWAERNGVDIKMNLPEILASVSPLLPKIGQK